MKVRPAQVIWTRPKGPAAAAGVTAGDLLLQANGRTPRDYIDYRYLAAESRVSLKVRKPDGELRRILIRKHEDEDLGLRFDEDVFDGIRTCRNRCPFCFVSQLPKGLRPALYVRDDDYRLSFLHGNFITLTNLTPADRRRIVRYRLSPLYVSVHATDPDTRRRLFGRSTPDPLEEMAGLAAKGIEFHTQIVVCPGVNDGRDLEQTVMSLAALHPGVRSVGVVPVGITRHRGGLPRLRAVSPSIARRLVSRIQSCQRSYRKTLGSRFVFAADEFYLLSGLPIPPRSQYEGMWQLGNGIGCARLFLDELRRLRSVKLPVTLSVLLVTGEMAAGMVKMLAEKLKTGGSVRPRVCIVRNRLLGRSVTTAGLLAGRDIARTAGKSPRPDVAIIPATAVREGEGFLDGMSAEDLAARLETTVLVAGGPRQAVAALKEYARGRGGR